MSLRENRLRAAKVLCLPNIETAISRIHPDRATGQHSVNSSVEVTRERRGNRSSGTSYWIVEEYRPCICQSKTTTWR